MIHVSFIFVDYSKKMIVAGANLISSLALDIREQKWAEFLIVFLAFFLGAKFGQYFFLIAQTSPALIWPPAGIGLAAVLLRGYKMWVPIAAASFLATATSPNDPPLLVIMATTVGQPAGLLLGVYILKKINFSMTFDSVRDVIVFCIGALFFATIAPLIITWAQTVAGVLSDSIYLSWSRGWAGRLLSILILTPLIVTWLTWRPRVKTRGEVLEKILALAILAISIYLLFWSKLAQSLSFIALLLMMVALFWVAIRMNFRTMTLALFLITIFGILGATVGPIGADGFPLNTRLFSIELFLILIAPIFYLFTALSKQHRVALAISRRRSEELEGALHRLEKSDRQKDAFISTLAHELRNPLGAILNSLEFLQMKHLRSEETKEPLGIAVRQSRQIDKMLRSLLDASRVQQGKVELEMQKINAVSIIKRASETIKPLLRKGKQHFTVEIPDAGFEINCDPMRVEQILINLLSNAIKYTEKDGQITLTVSEENDYAVFRVKDTGRGLTSDMIDKIFDLFVQVNQTNSIQGGLGIGLTLSRDLALLHGGTLTVRSAGLGKGSEFTLRIPINTDFYMAKKKQKSESSVKLPKRRRILLVDDNADLVHIFEKILKMLGQDVRSTLDSEQALTEARAFKPDIIFLDIGLPNKDGHELAREFRAEKEFDDATLVALSGYGQPEDKLRSQKSGFDAHLVKPVGIEEIRKILVSGIKND